MTGLELGAELRQGQVWIPHIDHESRIGDIVLAKQCDP